MYTVFISDWSDLLQFSSFASFSWFPNCFWVEQAVKRQLTTKGGAGKFEPGSQ